MADSSDFLRRLLVDVRPKSHWDGRFSRLRYLHRQLMKPPDIPHTPFKRLNLALYENYGHPYSGFWEAAEAHAVCLMLKLTSALSERSGLPFHPCLVLLTIILVPLIVLFFHVLLLTSIYSLYVTVALVTDVTLQVIDMERIQKNVAERLAEAGNQSRSLWLLLSWSEETDLSWADLVYRCFLLLIILPLYLIGFSFVVTAFGWARERWETLVEERRPGLECSVCMLAKVSRLFEPCCHLACCARCARLLLKCPICKQWIKAESQAQVVQTPRSTPTTARASLMCVVCQRAEVSHILLPCCHVACCSQCARQAEDCPVCWEEVQRDHQVYLP